MFSIRLGGHLIMEGDIPCAPSVLFCRVCGVYHVHGSTPCRGCNAKARFGDIMLKVKQERLHIVSLYGDPAFYKKPHDHDMLIAARADLIYTQMLRNAVSGGPSGDDANVSYLLYYALRLKRAFARLQKLAAPVRLKQLARATQPTISLTSDDECCICLDTILSSDEDDDAPPAVSRVLPCGHVFHRVCIEHAGNTCPYRCA